jgi:hypothetical protein
MLLSPAWLRADSTTLTITVASANVHKAPSTGSAVLGQAPRGAVLQVTRELGSWVQVSWPAAQDGAGYVHVSWGSIARGPMPGARRDAPAAPARAPEPAPSAAAAAPADSARRIEPPPAARRPAYVTPAAHGLGLGARIGSSPAGFGISARGWRRNRLGLQLDLSRDARTTITASQVTAIQIEPSLLYSLPDRMTDYVWLRPYIGSGAALRRHSSSTLTPGGGSVSANEFGVQTFGGGEVSFAGAPQFAVSVDLNYHWYRTPVDGFDAGGLGVSLLGHWYVK